MTAEPVRSHASLPPDPPRAAPFRYWTTLEIARLRQYYPRGIETAARALPDRSMGAIYQKALQLGLTGGTRPDGTRPGRQKWTSTPELDAAIRRLYEQPPASGAINAFARKIGRPRWWVTKRATKLGLMTPRFAQPPWTPEEDELLDQTSHLALAVAARRFKKAGFPRSATAIQVRRKRAGVHPRENGKYFTACGLARLLGVDSTTVAGWIEKGWLVASRRGTARTPQQGGDEWWIHRRAVRIFIRDNAARVDLRKVDQTWFIDFAFGGDL